MKQVALFGGTFDPPTKAHEAIIEACLARDDMDEVWVMPSGNRADKPGMSSAETRMMLLETMQKETFANAGKLVLSQFEILLPVMTETYLSAQRLQHAYPDYQFWYVFGADSYEAMPQWSHGPWLQQNLGMLLVRRVGYVLPEPTDRVRHLAVGEIVDQGISSSMVREAIMGQRSVDAYVSKAVVKEIALQNLYCSL